MTALVTCCILLLCVAGVAEAFAGAAVVLNMSRSLLLSVWMISRIIVKNFWYSFRSFAWTVWSAYWRFTSMLLSMFLYILYWHHHYLVISGTLSTDGTLRGDAYFLIIGVLFRIFIITWFFVCLFFSYDLWEKIFASFWVPLWWNSLLLQLVDFRTVFYHFD